jgi:cobalt-zinc-cadmium efflux system membrane fusion protein
LTKKLAVAGLVLTMVVIGCSKKSSDAEDAGNESSAVPDVTVTKVVRAPIADNLMVSGNLAAAPNHDAKVAPMVPGRVARVLVVEGTAVKEGQILAELDATLLVEQERQAEAAVAQAKASAENARLSLDREQGLLGRGISSRKEVEDARTQLAVNTGALNQAEAGLASARAQRSRTVVRAPFAGTVVKRFASVGEQVDGTAAQPVIEVAQIDNLELMGTVPAALLSDIKSGQPFKFTQPSAPDTEFTATVAAILPAVDPATNNGTVRIRIDNSKHLLKLGEFLTLEVPLKGSGARLVVPKQSIYPDESGEPHVYKVSGDQAGSVAVQVGVQTKDRAEILTGVQEGDVVIVSGGYGLPEKAKVNVKK